MPARTEPPEPGSTAPFNQKALDAVKAGAGCWVWSGVLNEWLFWVRDEERKAKAIRRGIDPGGIWTLEELTGVQGMPPEGLRDVAKIKRAFAGTVQPGEVPARWRDALNPLEPAVAEEQEAERAHHQATVPYRLNIGGRTQLVWLPEGLEPEDVIQCAKMANPGLEVSNKPPPQGWPRLEDIPEIPKSGTPQPVEAWTPSGRRRIVTAYSEEHAAAIQRMNQPPAPTAEQQP